MDSTGNGERLGDGRGLYVALLSIHGLIRGHNLELGVDSDTGGQVKYVIELARELAADPRVAQVDLLTRQILDEKVGAEYAAPTESLGGGAYIVRLRCGPKRYLRKEKLWPHLASFGDQALRHFRRLGHIPDLLHSHYADAGYVGSFLSGCLGVPLVHTGHSLGRLKEQCFLEQGATQESIETQFNMRQRIEAEEMVLDNAALVVASTQQEVKEQYLQYENYDENRMIVIPPGVDLRQFAPAKRGQPPSAIQKEVDRFLRSPGKPIILALSRPDRRKNLETLIHTYGEDHELQELANLVIVAGNRDWIPDMERSARKVLTDLLLEIDRHDLYGKVAYPKHHTPEDVPDLYRLAASRRGVLVNVALTEPFGLTLLEAGACGLPVVATNDGGPREILGHCENGLLIDPLDRQALAQALKSALTDRERWKRWSQNGVKRTRSRFSWPSHTRTYLRAVRKLVHDSRGTRLVQKLGNRLVTSDRILITDIDNTLVGDRKGVRALLERLKNSDPPIGLGVATGRHFSSTLEVLEKWNIPQPDLLICSVGSEIYYGNRLEPDRGWIRHIDYRWDADGLRRAMQDFPGLKMQETTNQSAFKISYLVDVERIPPLSVMRSRLRALDLHATLIFSHERYLDLLPIRASKGRALRYVAFKWGIPLERVVVAGDSGNDAEMLRGNTLAVVVGNHSPEVEKLRGRPLVYFASAGHAWGILEGLEHYKFFQRPLSEEVIENVRPWTASEREAVANDP